MRQRILKRPPRTRVPRTVSDAWPRMDALEPRVVLAAVSWDAGGGDGLWSNPLNWSNDALPTAADEVAIDLPGQQASVIADVPIIRVGSLRLNESLLINRVTALNVNGSFDLDADASLRINGLVNWVEGEWDAESEVLVNAKGLLNIGASQSPTSGSVTLAADLTNRGTVSWRGGAVVLDAVITNAAGKSFNIASPLGIVGDGSILNQGVIRRASNDDTTTIGVLITNGDRILAFEGTLRFETPAQGPGLINTGVVSAFGADSRVVIAADSLHTAGKLAGVGDLSFSGGSHVFEGLTIFTLHPTTFDGGATIRIAGQGAKFYGTLAFDDVSIVLDADLALERINGLALIDQPQFVMTSTVVSGDGTLRFEGILAWLQASDVTFNTDVHLDGWRNYLTVGGDDPNMPGIAIGPGATLTVRGTTNALYHRSGSIAIAAGGSLRSEFNGLIETGGTEIGSGPDGGSFVFVRGELIRIQRPAGPTQTVISAPMSIDFAGSSRTGIDFDVRAGTLTIIEPIDGLSPDPATGLVTLRSGIWHVRSGAVLELPSPIESIAEDVVVQVYATGAIPALHHLAEIRGSLGFRDTDTTFATLAPTIEVSGYLTKLGSGSLVIATPIENFRTGRIFALGGTLEITGALNAKGRFINRGQINGGFLVVNVDTPERSGTLVNRGPILANASIEIRGSVLCREGSFIRAHCGPAGSTIQITGSLTQNGRILAFIVTSNVPPPQGPWRVVEAASYSGRYDERVTGGGFQYAKKFTYGSLGALRVQLV